MDRVLDLATAYIVFQMVITTVVLAVVIAFFVWIIKQWNKPI